LIKKERTVPLTIKKYEALLRRLQENHPKRPLIEEQLAKFRKGFDGEKSIDYFLRELSKNEYYIFHDLRLPYRDDKFAQIDVIILSSRFLLIIEVKNISGTLTFDPPFKQLIRVKDDKEEVFLDPLIQLKRHQKVVSSIVTTLSISQIPIETLVVITDPNAIIKSTTNSREIYGKVSRPFYLPQNINSFESKYKQDKLSKKDIQKISRYFLKKHTPLNLNVLSQFQIEISDIRTGVHCPKCNHLPLLKKSHRNKWYCGVCDEVYRDAHLHALKDYALLINPYITNKECRKFLHLSSTQSTYRLLSKLQLERFGGTKGKKYYIKIDV